jgi:hypothetical protein
MVTGALSESAQLMVSLFGYIMIAPRCGIFNGISAADTPDTNPAMTAAITITAASFLNMHLPSLSGL